MTKQNNMLLVIYYSDRYMSFDWKNSCLTFEPEKEPEETQDGTYFFNKYIFDLNGNTHKNILEKTGYKKDMEEADEKPFKYDELFTAIKEQKWLLVADMMKTGDYSIYHIDKARLYLKEAIWQADELYNAATTIPEDDKEKFEILENGFNSLLSDIGRAQSLAQRSYFRSELMYEGL